MRKSNGSEAFPRRQEQNQSRQAEKRSQEKSKRVLKFVKVSTTKSKHRRHTRVLQMEKFFQKEILKMKAERDKQDKSVTSRSNKQRTNPKGKNKRREN